MTTSEPSPRQARQALRWVIRCSAGPLPERQQRTLQRWLQSDPRHALAWRQQQAFWQRLDAAGPEVLAALPELTADRRPPGAAADRTAPSPAVAAGIGCGRGADGRGRSACVAAGAQ